MTLVLVTAYHSFSGEVEASNTPTIRRLTPSCRHQLPRITLGPPFDYLIQRLHCDLNDEGRVGQAQAHLEMISKALDNLKKELDTRGFGSASVTHEFNRIH